MSGAYGLTIKQEKFCCERFIAAAHEYAGKIDLYPETMVPSGNIEQDARGKWAVPGCCGGGCNVLNDIKFCPFCGKSLPD